MEVTAYLIPPLLVEFSNVRLTRRRSLKRVPLWPTSLTPPRRRPRRGWSFGQTARLRNTRRRLAVDVLEAYASASFSQLTMAQQQQNSFYMKLKIDLRIQNWFENGLQWNGIELNWIELFGPEFNWINSPWLEWNWVGSSCIELKRVEMIWLELIWIDLDWSELYWIALNCP